ncbi:AAA family ATPase [Phenylobacterium sp.]|jgi:ATP-dependent Clp protease ATP-binding subunit ClpA|uniref:AAA family ATPase n=1 Tax=Phenylobacterium sp. TaxID=1871053 RepID=UPI002E3126B0|nr:AAA family ATPase [Phenylobacterium sp.]HEX4712431.1 AAA family ATPase [Phenylobacterium sp.]
MFPARLNRILPYVFLATGILATIQLASTLMRFLHKSGIADWVIHNRGTLGWVFASLAAIAWLFVLLGALRRRHRLPKFLSERRWLMDILDRLTNRAELERRISEQAESIFVDAEALAATLKAKVVGQDKTCTDLSAQIRRRLALKQRGKPVGVFLFAGPPGAGKTWLGKVLAEALGRKLLHFDMTQFSAGGFGATSLFGAAKGYVGSQEYGKLTAGLRDTPDAVVLLDEIEKAHSDVHKNFLTAWNDGFITEKSDGKQINTNRAIFVLTTNAAVDTLADLSRQYANEPDELRRAAVGALREAGFAPEVLNRIDRIFVFEPLSGLDIARVAALEIERMISGYGLTVADGGIDPEVLLDLMARQQRMGSAASSRDLTRAIEESIADSLIAAKEQGATAISLVKSEGGVRAEVAAATPALAKAATPKLAQPGS